MQVAKTPRLDRLVASGVLGTACFVPESLSPGSDVATLSLLGYDPELYYTGRAPLEAIAQGIELGPQDWAVRCNLVTLENGFMKSFSAGHISTEEAAELLKSLQEPLQNALKKLSADTIRFYSGVSYRNLMIYHAPEGNPLFAEMKTFAPHDLSDQPFEPGLPEGPGSEILRTLMEESAKIFATHPVNRRRIEQGKLPATHVWLWGHGRKPQMPSFAEKYAVSPGAMITAVDLHRGIAGLFGWDVIEVPGATGYVDTDYAAKGRYAAELLEKYDVICVHVEAPDEAGHEGSIEKKVRSMEDIDEKLLPPILDALARRESWRLFISPDHPTPIATKTHSRDFVPWLIAGSDVSPDEFQSYDENTATRSSRNYPKGHELMKDFLTGKF